MKIERNLNLLIPLDGMTIHSVPISRAVFEQYYAIIGKTYATLAQDGLLLMGPKMALLRLKELAGDTWDDVERGLVNEIIRLSNVCMVGDQGWRTVPLAVAMNELDEDTLAEVKGQLVFFTCVSKAIKRDQCAAMLDTINGLWGSQTTSLSSTEYMSSLPTSTAPASSGETAEGSSVPH